MGGGAGTAIHRRAPLLCSFSLLSLSLSLARSRARSLACTFLAQGGSLGPAFLCVYVGWGEREKGANEMRSSGKKKQRLREKRPCRQVALPFSAPSGSRPPHLRLRACTGCTPPLSTHASEACWRGKRGLSERFGGRSQKTSCPPPPHTVSALARSFRCVSTPSVGGATTATLTHAPRSAGTITTYPHRRGGHVRLSQPLLGAARRGRDLSSAFFSLTSSLSSPGRLPLALMATSAMVSCTCVCMSA